MARWGPHEWPNAVDPQLECVWFLKMNLESYFPALKFCFHVLLSTCSPTSRVEAWRHLPAAGYLCGAYKRWALRGLEAPVAWRACITSWKKRGTFLVGESRFEGFE